MTIMRICWCGNPRLPPFGQAYGECMACGTLVYLGEIRPEKLLVHDDETDFYGKKYWLERQKDAFGTADIFSRARTDLTERNLHWLKTLFKYRLPPAKVLELGCSHGSFVGLMRMAGYDASGVEMSPWVVEFGKKTFDVPIALGPLENIDVSPGSIDIIVAMDVLEHLPDPAKTMRRCLELLSPDGMLLLQTPQFKNGTSYDEFAESNARFLGMMIPEEHLYLFSEESVSRLFRELGAEHIAFQPAMFSHYDMFVVVSRRPLASNTLDQIDLALNAKPQRRYIQALLDLRERELTSEADRIARGRQIEALTHMIKESEADRAARGEQIETLTRMVKESETDRCARGEQVEALIAILKQSETNRATKEEQIRQLTENLKRTTADGVHKDEEIYELLTDLRRLFGHRLFRLLASLARWREAKKLEDRINQP